MRAKFNCDEVTKYAWGVELVKLSAVYDDGNPENNEFAEATPSGDISITIDNPKAVGFLTPGKAYYVDFTPED